MKLSQRAIEMVPSKSGFFVDTTLIDGRAHALVCCTPCSWYGMHVSSRIGGGVRMAGQLTFRTASFEQLASAASAHKCPPEVLAAVQAARGGGQ